AYARIAFKLFGDRVSKWFTFNEPIVPVEGGYLYDFHYPNKVDAKAAVQVAYNTAVASAKAVKAFHEMDVNNGKIGIILNLTPTYPRSRNSADLRASEAADLFFDRSFRCFRCSQVGRIPASRIRRGQVEYEFCRPE